ncbi:MAG: Brp/Blh family beta-carotene 15,15'-dioxygenase [Actinomycetota bacterium]
MTEVAREVATGADPRASVWSPSVERFHQRAIFGPVLVGTVAITALTAVWTPPDTVSIAVVALVVAVVGIPHGSVDHLVVAEATGRNDVRSTIVVLGRYTLTMAAVGLGWLLAPAVVLALFLVISVHHFGQSDLADLPTAGVVRLTSFWSRGIVLVGLPLVAHLDDVGPTIDALAGTDPTTWSWLADHVWLWTTAIVVQHAVMLAVLAPTLDASTTRRELVTACALGALFVAAPPLVGFAIYFGLWHSLRHLLALSSFLGEPSAPLRSTYRKAMPLTLISLTAVAAVSVALVVSDRSDLFVPVLFAFIAMVTVPHMFVVEQMWAPPTSPTDQAAMASSSS